MKLLYATSMTLPSRHANRRQILSMARAFNAYLGDNFLLGLGENAEGIDTGAKTVAMGRGVKSFFLAWKYAQLIRERGVTRIYTREDRLFFFLRIYIMLLRLPVLLFFEAHTLGHGFFFNYAVFHAQKVVTLTKGLQEDLAARGVSSPILVAHDGVDLERFVTEATGLELRRKFSIPEDAIVAGYVGRYNTNEQKDKGVGEFIRAVGLASVHTPLHLLIVGLAPRDVLPVEHLCDESGVSPERRMLVQYVPQAEVVVAMRAANLLVMNYPNAPHFARYMSPMKLFEYMASRTPIITTDLPSVREILSEREAFFVPPGDVQALSQMLLFVAHNKEEAARRAAAAFEKVKGYTWALRAQAIVDFIASA